MSLGDAQQLLTEADKKNADGDRAGAIELLSQVAHAPVFSHLPENQQSAVLAVYGALLLDAGKPNEALAELRAATAYDAATGQWWLNRLTAASQTSDLADQALCLIKIAKTWPASLADVNGRYIIGLNFQMRSRTDLHSSQFDMLQALAQANWQPSETVLAPSGLWMDLTAGLLERGLRDDARRIAHKITDPDSITRMVIAKRFDPITLPDSAYFDPVRAEQSQIEFLRQKLRDYPNRLEPIQILAGDLSEMGKDEEALALLDGAIQRAHPLDDSKPPFTDMDQLIWVYNQRAYTLLALGRTDEAVAAMKRGAARPEQGGLNVSQQLNLGVMEVRLGKGADAFAAVETVEDASPYGNMVREYVRAEAALELDDHPRFQAAMDYIKAHQNDDSDTFVDVLLDSGDQDGAAREIIKLLADPAKQPEILEDFQDYETTKFPLAFDLARHARIVEQIALVRPND
jgi:tetratricopeptide (TPR) repeat protein